MSKRNRSLATWAGAGAQRQIAQAIRASRKAAGLTLKQIEEKTGINYAHLCRIEHGNRSIPSIGKLDSLALAVNVDPLVFRAILIAEDLTPEQRATLAAHISRME